MSMICLISCQLPKFCLRAYESFASLAPVVSPTGGNVALPQDLKNYRAPQDDDAFNVIPPDLAVVLFLACGFLGYLLGRVA